MVKVYCKDCVKKDTDGAILCRHRFYKNKYANDYELRSKTDVNKNGNCKYYKEKKKWRLW